MSHTGANVRHRLRQGCLMLLRDGNAAPAAHRGWDGDGLAWRLTLASAGRSESSWRTERAA